MSFFCLILQRFYRDEVNAMKSGEERVMEDPNPFVITPPESIVDAFLAFPDFDMRRVAGDGHADRRSKYENG